MHHMIPKTYFSLHDVELVDVTHDASMGRPLVLQIFGSNGTTQVTLFFRDADYSRRMAAAIDGVERGTIPLGGVQ
jgi:hypothetical protein